MEFFVRKSFGLLSCDFRLSKNDKQIIYLLNIKESLPKQREICCVHPSGGLFH